MLENSTLELLQNKKNLLAFSAGGDSTALFFLLLRFNVKFDVAIVDYGVRKQSREEVRYAQELAQTHNLNCHLLKALPIEKNFEANAREIRYAFFEELIKKLRYENLLTAHHLGDRFEWTLMQFCKGAGCVELSGMRKVDKRREYSLIRPLLHLEKEELLDYLKKEKIKYFEDATNLDEEIKRNSFRSNHSKPLLKEHLSGIKKSFEYLDRDRDELIQEADVRELNRLAYFKSSSSTRSDVYNVDKYIKTLGTMMSASERELLKTNSTVIIARRFIVNFHRDYVFILKEDSKKVDMPHKFKEECRVLKIEPKLRSYLYEDKEAFKKVKALLSRS